MSDFIKDVYCFRAVRKSDVSAAMINPNFIDGDTKRTAIIFVLKNGEKAQMFFKTIDDAVKVISDL